MPPLYMPKRSGLVGQLIDKLLHDIQKGRWPVGSRLPVESDLLEEFGVSRMTLRQAVQALVHVGMLETIQGSGTFVRATSEVDAVLSRFLGGEDAQTLLEVRLAIESESAALAAQRAEAGELRALAEIVDVSRDIVRHDDPRSLATLSHRFHRGVVRASGNSVLLRFYDSVGQGAERTFLELGGPQTPAQFVNEHQEILDAICEGESALALRLSREHLLPVISENQRQ